MAEEEHPHRQALLPLRRSLGSPELFAIVYSLVASALYFSLAAVSKHALGLTPYVFLAAGFFFVLCQMSYVEGASLHQERAGSTVFARYAFNELISFITGWALLLDYVILLALTAFTATNYLAAFDGSLGHGPPEAIIAIAIIVFVAFVNVRGITAARLRRIASLAVLDLGIQVLIIVLGLALVFDAGNLTDPIELGTRPTWSEAIFGVTIAAAAFIGLESGSGLAGEVAVGRRGLRRLIAVRTGTVLLVYVGIAVVALSALPASGNSTELARRYFDAPLLGVAKSFHQLGAGADVLRLMVGGLAFIVLIAAANSAMLGLSRLAYSLARNRQVPSAVGRLHPTRATPVVTITIAAVIAIGLVLPEDLDFLIGIFAFGTMLAFTVAHVSVIVLRYREPTRDRPYKMPLSLRLGGGELPLPAVLGALLSGAGWVSVIVLHEGARYVGFAWLAAGTLLYVVYRTTQGKSLLKRVTIPEVTLQRETEEHEFGSILVPLLGTSLDDDIMQTAGRLASDDEVAEALREGDEKGVTAWIEAIWIHEIPMSLPIDASLPDARRERGRAALARAKEVGEEYAGVKVETATARARRAGQAIVDEARRRGVEVIVMGAEEPSRIRGGRRLGGVAPLENYVGEATRYVLDKAPCRVILTAPGTSGAGPAGTAAGSADPPPPTR